MAKTSAEVRAYNRRYYLKKKHDISVRRKQKYASDPGYREKARRSARARYKKDLKSFDKRGGYTVKRVDGRELFTISYVATLTSRKEDVIRSWEKQGVIPLSTYTDTRGWRLYTDKQIRFLVRAFKQYDEGAWSKDIVQQYLNKYWNEKGEMK